MKNWLCSLFVVATLVVTALAVPHPAFAYVTQAPEVDPSMVVAGLGVAGGAGVLIWERLRRRR